MILSDSVQNSSKNKVKMKRKERRMAKVIGGVILVLLSVCGIIYVVNFPYGHTTINKTKK